MSLLGVAGLTVLRENGFDVIILDIMMPDMDGYKVFENIKKISAVTPVVAWTAAAASFKIKCLRMGFTRVLDKGHLAEKIDTMLAGING